MHNSVLPIFLGGNLSPLLDISERNFFTGGGGGGVHVTQYTPPAYAPDLVLLQSLLIFRRSSLEQC